MEIKKGNDTVYILGKKKPSLNIFEIKKSLNEDYRKLIMKYEEYLEMNNHNRVIIKLYVIDMVPFFLYLQKQEIRVIFKNDQNQKSIT